MQLWAAKVDAYRSLTLPNVVLTHEDLYDEAALTRKVANLTAFGLRYPAGQTSVQLPPLSEGGTNAKMSGAFTKEEFASARQYESSRAWLKYYSAADIDFVNSIIGEERMAHYGFERISQAVTPAPSSISISSSALDSSTGELTDSQHRKMLDFLDDHMWKSVAS